MGTKLKIRTYPDPVLKKKTLPVTDFGPVTQKLFDDMIETMHVSDGVGLAAPQIGISQQIFIACPTMRRGEEHIMVNAVIEKKSGTTCAAEGCLSLPGISGEVVRATKLRLTFQDPLGEKHTVEVTDFFARVIQHEMDHLNGILLIDHFKGAERERLIENYKALKNKGM
ncbi:MAG: peptide deformylase [Candidatus Omnitrophota bacterium]